MNYSAVIKNLGAFSISVSVLFLPSLLWALWFWEKECILAFVSCIVVAVGVGSLFLLLGRRAKKQLYNRETLALVGLGWLLIAAYGALPFVFTGKLAFWDAYFESMSGFTTTGATVFADIEALPQSILFWRSFTHWLGGLGIILLLIIVLPFLGAGGKLLYRSEVPGVDKNGLRPRIKDSAIILFKIYAALTLAMTVLLMIAGMDFFNALCHTFGTLATGGFSTRNASIAAYDSLAIEIIIIIFMVIAGTSFGLLYCLSRGEWKKILGNSEWRLYMMVLGISTLLIALNLTGLQGHVIGIDYTSGKAESMGFGQALRMAAFQTVSIMTTTGFCTEDFNLWPLFSRTLLVLLMLVGGCSGSTGGGLKVIRILILAKILRHHLLASFKPKTMHVLRINNMIIAEETQHAVLSFFLIHICAIAVGTLLLSGQGIPAQTALTAVIATLNNIGPGLELVGAIENYSFIPTVGKIALTLLMAMGRLELYAILVLFVPSFWHRN